jgi:hypothetical protein
MHKTKAQRQNKEAAAGALAPQRRLFVVGLVVPGLTRAHTGFDLEAAAMGSDLRGFHVVAFHFGCRWFLFRLGSRRNDIH